MYREQRRTNSSRILKEVGASQKWRCNVCGDLLKSTFQLDHRIPLHKGGSNDVSNFQALCCECHAKKTQEEKKRSSKWVVDRTLHVHYVNVITLLIFSENINVVKHNNE